MSRKHIQRVRNENRRLWQINYLRSAIAIWSLFLATPSALASFGGDALSSEDIASSALKVAENTRTTGRCYNAVCRALHPLGVELSGAAAYQAEPLLLKDSRFIPLTIFSVDELRRGDIIVYTRSTTHQFGHISVYEGNYQEASDHVSPITHTQAYGGATVFRLRNDSSVQDPRVDTGFLGATGSSGRYLPNYGSAMGDQTSYQQASYQASNNAQAPYPRGFSSKSRNLESNGIRNVVQEFKQDYMAIKKVPIGRSIVRRVAHFLFD